MNDYDEEKAQEKVDRGEDAKEEEADHEKNPNQDLNTDNEQDHQMNCWHGRYDEEAQEEEKEEISYTDHEQAREEANGDANGGVYDVNYDEQVKQVLLQDDDEEKLHAAYAMSLKDDNAGDDSNDPKQRRDIPCLPEPRLAPRASQGSQSTDFRRPTAASEPGAVSMSATALTRRDIALRTQEDQTAQGQSASFEPTFANVPLGQTGEAVLEAKLVQEEEPIAVAVRDNGKMRRYYILGAIVLVLVIGGLVGGLIASRDDEDDDDDIEPPPCPTVFFNELHYDNGGDDVGEFFEIAGPAGTNLTGWDVYLYSGNDGTLYDTINLSGTIPDQSNGYGTLNFTVDLLQNGPSDGLALVHSGSVIQLVSYEGIFEASDGPANGTTSEDIGVSEPGSTPIGYSLQLKGDGACYNNFTWSEASQESPGQVNANQTFVEAAGSSPTQAPVGPPSPTQAPAEPPVEPPFSCPDIFVNELHYDNDGDDKGEFFEIAGPAGTDLGDWSAVLYNGNGGKAYDTIYLNGTIPDQSNGHGTLSFEVGQFQNGSPDGLALVESGTVIQFLSYEGNFTAVEGPASGMTSEDIGVSESSSTPVGYSLQLKGDGVCYNDFTWSEASEETPGEVNVNQTFALDS